MLLGFIVSERGTELNQEKISTIECMGLIQNVKGVQCHTGCLVALSRFVLRLGERVLLLYKLLKKSKLFEWNHEVQQALDEVKCVLNNPPVITPLTFCEPLLLYIAGTTQMVSAVLVIERKEEGHVPRYSPTIYFISEVLSDSKTQYLHILKIIYVVIVARRKLRHYFDAHSSTIEISFPLSEVIHNKDYVGKMAKWALELTRHFMEYSPQIAIKLKALVDFIVEWTKLNCPGGIVVLEHVLRQIVDAEGCRNCLGFRLST